MPPIGYRQYHAVDFSNWKDGAEKPAFQDLARALQSRMAADTSELEHAPKHSIVPPETKAPEQRRILHPVALGGAIAAVVLVALISVFALRGGGDPNATVESTPQTIEHKASIAVLPFVALSNDDSDEYFGKGIAEELLNALTQFPDLKVAARTSAFSFDGQNTDLREVGEKLGVAHVLEGSVRRAGDTVRITAQLIRASDGFHLWSETYERELTDVFAIQDEIVREISRNLQVRLGVGGGTGRASGEGVNQQAYEQYLRGLYLWGNRDRDLGNRLKALTAFQLATEFDPDFAGAWGAIGLVSAFSDPNSMGDSPEAFVDRAEAALERTLALDPDNVAAHIGRAAWHTNYKIDIKTARSHLDRALELAPNRAEAHYAAAFYWGTLGDIDATLSAFNRAIALDPLNNAFRRTNAATSAMTGRFDEAFAFYDACSASECMDPRMVATTTFFASVFAGDEKRIEDALSKADTALGADNNLSDIADVVTGRERTATSKPILRVKTGPLVGPEFIGIMGPVIAKTADADQLFEILERLQAQNRLLSEPYSMAPFYGHHPYPEWVLRHPRYHAIWAQPGMAELAAARRANGQTAGLPLPIEGDAE